MPQHNAQSRYPAPPLGGWGVNSNEVMKQIVISILFFLSFGTLHAATLTAEEHPRLLLRAGEEQAILNAVQQDATWAYLHNTIIAEADKMISLPNLERIITGSRLLEISREALRRLFYLSYAYRTTNNTKYSDRAKNEMLNLAAFSDWHPGHFLDVAEMTTAVAIGYDWCYDRLSASERTTIKDAIKNHGLIASNNHTSWTTMTNNWIQVCCAGTLFGALAILEDESTLANQVINRSKNLITTAHNFYKPDGAYPEGPGYWDYGTAFNVLMYSALEKYYGNDSGLSNSPGFLQTGAYSQALVSPCMYVFGYADSGSGFSISPAVFWFYNKTQDPSLLYFQKKKISLSSASTFTSERNLPAIMIWGAANNVSMDNLTPPAELFYKAGGETPVAVMRSSWESSEAVYLAYKLGSNTSSHAHMDIGSFIFEAENVRWAVDLGNEDYTVIESHIGSSALWNNSQNSKRWDVFRIGNLSHSVPNFDGGKQTVFPAANSVQIASTVNTADLMSVTADLTPAYSRDVQKIERTAALVDKKYAKITDVVTTGNTSRTMSWNMTAGTESVVLDHENNQIILNSNSKRLYIKVDCPRAITLKTWSTVSPNSYERKNTGTIRVGFDVTLPSFTTTNINVLLVPGSVEDENKPRPAALSLPHSPVWKYMDSALSEGSPTDPNAGTYKADASLFDLSNWTSTISEGSRSFYIGVSSGKPIANTMEFVDNKQDGTKHTAWLISPPLDFSGTGIKTITFRAGREAIDQQSSNIDVLYSSDYTTSIERATWTVLKSQAVPDTQTGLGQSAMANITASTTEKSPDAVIAIRADKVFGGTAGAKQAKYRVVAPAITFTPASSISSTNKNKTIIYDNMMQTITIESSEEIKDIMLFSIIGEKILLNPCNNRIISIEHLPDGIYICKVLLANGEIIIKKFLK